MRILCIVGVSFLLASSASACPPIAGIPDFNCDGRLVLAFTGDSLVVGIGDTANGNKGGYPLRLARALPQAEVKNLGEPGLHTTPFLSSLSRAFRQDGEAALREALLQADLVVLDLGRNDRWDFGPPSKTYRNLKRAAALIKQKVGEAGKTPPLVVTAVLMLPNRGSQGPWVRELNTLILRGSRAPGSPADLRFDTVSKRLLSGDQIHPTSAGYSALFKTLNSYLKKKATRYMLQLRTDADSDGVFDLFEPRYGTDPALADTDGDGFSDGEEIFVRSSDPLIPD